jgi:pimeloyl-ACP methyl ester carboxylesterase
LGDVPRLHYEVAGNGFPLLLIPGAGASGSAWHDAGYVEMLADSFACVTVDPPGMGGSAEPRDDAELSVESIARSIVGVADELGFERFAIWGASAGGSEATVAAVEYGPRIAALILTATWPADLLQWRDWIVDLANLFREQGGRTALATIFAAEGVPMPLWAAEQDPPSAVVAGILEGQLDYPWRSRAMPSMIDTPTLIIVGALDDPHHEARVSAQQMADAEVVELEGLGHAGSWIYAPDLAVPHVRRFLQARLNVDA